MKQLTQEERQKIEEHFLHEINRLRNDLEEVLGDVTDLVQKGNKAAGVRARNKLHRVREACSDLRSRIKPSNLPAEKLRNKYKNYGFKKQQRDA